MMPFENGKMLYYAHAVPDKGIWRIPANGGSAVQVTGPIAKDSALAVTDEGIYYAALRTPQRESNSSSS
jgi:hypothetical protein